MRIVFVGGGTGGHFYPLIAIAEALREKEAEQGTSLDLYYMGPDPYKPELLEALNITHSYCPAGKRRRYKSILNFLDIFKIFFGAFIAFQKLYWIYPDVIMSKGGYTSVPVVFAAWLLRIPVVIHESDATPGKANKFASHFARYIGVAHDDVAHFFPEKKVALVGMPIRKSFFTSIENPYEVMGIPHTKPVILFTGGSLGAERINNLVIDSLDDLLPTYTIIHQTGPDHIEGITKTVTALFPNSVLLSSYYPMGHLPGPQFAAAQEIASLIVSRAGSGTIFEIALRGKPSILIPIPEDISHDQRTNAYAYANSGATIVMEEDNLNDDLLVAEIRRIMEKTDLYEKMSSSAKNFTNSDAAYTLADTLLAIGNEHV